MRSLLCPVAIYEQSPHLLPTTAARENVHTCARACAPLKFRVSSSFPFFYGNKNRELHPDSSTPAPLRVTWMAVGPLGESPHQAILRGQDEAPVLVKVCILEHI